MTRILLASASILAFAGAAAAQDESSEAIIFNGDASFGFNDADAGEARGDDEDSGFFYEANLGVTLRATLDNGLVAESTFTIPVADTNLANELSVDEDFDLGLSIDGMGSIRLGDVPFAGEVFSFANMQSADFSEQDAEVVVRGESTLAGFTVVGSAIVTDADSDQPGERGEGVADDLDDYIDQISVGGNGNIGPVSLSFGYQEESDIIVRPDDVPATPVDENETEEGIYDTNNGDFNPDEQFGIAGGFLIRGIDVKLGYGQNLTDETESYGVQASYAFGPATLGAEYVFEPDAEFYGDDAEDFSYRVFGTYESGNILVEAEYGEEIGEEEYDVKVGYAFSEVTNVQLGYNDDDGGFIALRQGFGAGAFVEASYVEHDDDVGFGNDLYPDDIRPGATLRVGLEF
jgi:opacity protein-like surface antigen